MRFLLLFLTFLLLAGLYRFRVPLTRILRRFDKRNAERKAEQARQRLDAHAHYRETIRLADEQVEHVVPIAIGEDKNGASVYRYLFGRQQYMTRADAEAARYNAVIAKAREFYSELDDFMELRRPATYASSHHETDLRRLSFEEAGKRADVASGVPHEEPAQGGDAVHGAHTQVAGQTQRRDIV